MSGFEFGLRFSFFLITQLTITGQKFSKCLKNGTFVFMLQGKTIHVQSNLMECDVSAHRLSFGVVNSSEDALINIYDASSWTAVWNLRGWRRLARVCCLVKHFLHKQHGVHQGAFLPVNQWIFLFSAFKLVNDPLDYCNIERRRSKAKFWSGVFAESVYKLINMNHKHLLSCCVEILDSFNSRIHGVLEHLNSCLATKQVSKIFSF